MRYTGSENTKNNYILKGGIDLSIRTVTMITLGILLIALMYLTFQTTVESLIDSFIGSVQMPTVNP